MKFSILHPGTLSPGFYQIPLSVCVYILTLALHAPAEAQNFTPLGGGYDCMTLSNGEQFLVIRDNTSYTIVDSQVASKTLVAERRKITERARTLKDLASSIRQKKPSKSAIRLFAKLWRLTNGSDIDVSLLEIPDQRIETLKALAASVNEKKVAVARSLAAINGCKTGKASFPKGGILMYPSVKVLGLVGDGRQYSGWLFHDVALKTANTVKPGGYNGCFKFYWRDGTTTTYMSGLATEPCFNGSVNRFDNAVAACNASLPRGRVGFVIQHGSTITMDPPALDFLVKSAEENKPGVVFLRKPDSVPYDTFSRGCAAWNQG